MRCSTSLTSDALGRDHAERIPLVVHVLDRLTVGGLENGLVNLINHTPQDRYRHAIVCIYDFDAFRQRIRNSDVDVIALRKRPGHDLAVHARLWKALRTMKPDIVHTRNLGALEMQFVASCCRIKARVHGEHGMDVHDLTGTSRQKLVFRQALRPFVRHYTTVSKGLANWLIDFVGIPSEAVTQIYNGVDTRHFRPCVSRPGDLYPFADAEKLFIIGTVGRLCAVKDQVTLIRSFARLRALAGPAADLLRLVIVGDGPLMSMLREEARIAGVEGSVWLPGRRDDVARLMAGFDVFVLPSLTEGVSNTILEAMASGVAVIASNAGGNPEIVENGRTGALVPPQEPESLAEALLEYVRSPGMLRQHGIAARASAERRFSMKQMVDSYMQVYDCVSSREVPHA